MNDADQIHEGLWQGSQPPVGTCVRDAGFGMLVLCACEYQPPANAFPGVEVLHVPLDDVSGQVPDVDLLLYVGPTVQQVAIALLCGVKVLVTCYMGLNRSGLITGLALRSLTGWHGAACVDRIRTVRGSYALSNRQFCRIVAGSRTLLSALHSRS